MSTTVRKSVPLHPQELELLDRVRSAGTPENDALREATGIEFPQGTSEAESLRAILKIGIATIEDRVMEHGYAAMAAERDEDDRAFAAAMRRRTAERAARD